MRVKCLAQEHNTMNRPGLEPRPLDPESSALTTRPLSRLECKNQYPIYYHNGGKMAIIDTLFMTKMAEKPYPFGPHIPI